VQVVEEHGREEGKQGQHRLNSEKKGSRNCHESLKEPKARLLNRRKRSGEKETTLQLFRNELKRGKMLRISAEKKERAVNVPSYSVRGRSITTKASLPHPKKVRKSYLPT